MKILIVMGGFFPGKKYGGPPVSADNFCSLMKGYADCYILTHNHDMGENEPYPNIRPGWNDRGNAKVMYLSDSEYKYATFVKVVAEIRPDCLYLQGLFQECVLPCLRIAKKNSIKVVLAPRGELCAGAFKKKHIKLPYIWLMRIMGWVKDVVFQSTSVEETDAIRRYLGATCDRIRYLTNIPSITKTLPNHKEKVTGEGHFVFISRILWKKNLINAIRYFETIKGHATFDIYGPIEDENYWRECENAIKRLPSNISVNYCGVLSHDEIHKVFCQYDSFLFPTLSENYGHVIVEAMVTGCIPIISDRTPWTDIMEVGAGYAFPLHQNDNFVIAIQSIVDMDENQIKGRRHIIESYLENKLRIEELKKEYMNVFK